MGSSMFPNGKRCDVLDKNKDIPIKKLYAKYIFRFAVSYAFWSYIYALYNSFYDAGDSFIEKFKYFASYCLSGKLHTWYILVTIGIYMTLPIVKYLIIRLMRKTQVLDFDDVYIFLNCSVCF